MKYLEHLRIPGGPKTSTDDRRELRRIAKADAGPSERYLRNLIGDEVYESWDLD